MGLLLITHKSTRSENPITWLYKRRAKERGKKKREEKKQWEQRKGNELYETPHSHSTILAVCSSLSWLSSNGNVQIYLSQVLFCFIQFFLVLILFCFTFQEDVKSKDDEQDPKDGAESKPRERACAQCRKKIQGKFVLRALDQFWHEGCLKCSYCNTQLADIGPKFYFRGEMILCKRDYIR